MAVGLLFLPGPNILPLSPTVAATSLITIVNMSPCQTFDVQPETVVALLKVYYETYKKIIYFVKGRTYNGRYDGFYGKLNGNVAYDTDIIRQSLAGKAIQTTSAPLPDDETIIALRTDATISCNPNASKYILLIHRPLKILNIN